VRCVKNTFFDLYGIQCEVSLTIGKIYNAKHIFDAPNFYEFINDRGEKDWYASEFLEEITRKDKIKRILKCE
jgi:hypothetical protein